MANIWFVSDTHFQHANILKFLLRDGSRMREFSCVEEMDERMIDNWNGVVKPQDKVYHLGDVSMTRRGIQLLRRCHGHKRLVRGNHDNFPIKDYLQVFTEVYGSRLLDRALLCTHIPVHPENLKPRWINVHGHVHSNVTPDHYGPSYINVCVEYTNYTPVAMDDVLSNHRARFPEYHTEN